MKYSTNFNETFNFYLSNRNLLKFCPMAIPQIQYSSKGIDGKKAFYLFESKGKLIPTKHPKMFKRLFKFKASLNFHIKMWSESNHDTLITVQELNNMFKAQPKWVKTQLETMFYKKTIDRASK